MAALKRLLAAAGVLLCGAHAAAAQADVTSAGASAARAVGAAFRADASTSTWAGGGLLWKENYAPFGARQVNSWNAGWNHVWFAGHKYDAATALSYAGARYYAPALGRFMGIDPKEVDANDIHSFGRYGWGNNNPYRFADKDGHSPLDVMFFAGDLAALAKTIYHGGDVRSAAIDVGLSALGVVSPVPGTGQALKALKIAEKAVEAGRAAERAFEGVKDAAKASRVGPFAGESIPARSPARDFTAAERAEINAIGAKTGCHTCGRTDPGTKSGNFVPDHQPPSSLNPQGQPQRLYPHCLNCSREQGLEIARQLRQGGQ